MSKAEFRTAGRRPDRPPPPGQLHLQRQARYEGYAGDTLASALLANGVHLVGRSFKYHRPRGIVSAGVEEPNALVQLERGAAPSRTCAPPQSSSTTACRASSQNALAERRVRRRRDQRRPVADLRRRLLLQDLHVAAELLDEGLRARHPPRRRPRQAPAEPDPDRYDKMHAHCDVLVVGAGPAGLMAALAAGRAGARVILADEQNELGGSLLASTANASTAVRPPTGSATRSRS